MTQDEYYNPDLDAEVLERRKNTADLLVMLSGISFMEHYDPGIVTLNQAPGIVPDQPDRNLILVAWKIDDAPWKVRTTGLSRISETDEDAREGVTSFHPDAHSWSWGMVPFYDLAEATALRDRILRLTREFGLEIDSYEAEVVRRAD